MTSTETNTPPHIVIFGAGSIGCYLGGCLTAAGANVTLIGRPRIQKELDEHGMKLTDWMGRDQQVAPQSLQFSLSPDVLKTADYILLTVKSGDTAEAANTIAATANPEAVVVSFQNGLKNPTVLRKHLPNMKVVKGMVPFNVLSRGNGHFHCGTEGNLAIEDKNSEFGSLVNCFVKSNLPVDTYQDLSGIQWGKLLMNLNNSVNALSGIPLKEQLQNKTYRKVMALVIKEALAVMQSANIEPARTGKVIPKLMPHILSLPNWLFKIAAGATLKIDPEARSSMYEDLFLKRKTEIDYLNGEIVNLAESHDHSAPVNSLIVKLVKQAESEKTGSPAIAAEELLRKVKFCH